MGKDGWPFVPADPFPGAYADPFHSAQYVKDIYLKANSEYDGRYVPVFQRVAIAPREPLTRLLPPPPLPCFGTPR